MKSRTTLLLITLLVAVALFAAACSSPQTTPEQVSSTPATEAAPATTVATAPADASADATATPAMGQGQGRHGQGMGQGHGKGQGLGGPPEGMRERHQAPIPADYQGKTNPVPADEASLARGEEIYAQQCATCHGDGGMGDGPAGQGLNPAPAPIAHSSQMLSDSYLFWRISEGGAQFKTAMIPYKNILSEPDIWDVINYTRALGSGQVQPRQNMGGQAMDPNAEAQMHADMLAAGVEQGVITQAEADLFTQVHDKLDAYKTSHMDELRSFMGSPDEMQKAMLDALVKSGDISQDQADAFTDIHDRLVAAGIMQ